MLSQSKIVPERCIREHPDMMSASEGGRGVTKKQIKADEGEGGVGQVRTSIAEVPPLGNWPPSD